MFRLLSTVLLFVSQQHCGKWYVVSDTNSSYTGAHVTVHPRTVYVTRNVGNVVPVQVLTTLNIVKNTSKLDVSLEVAEHYTVANVAGSVVKLSTVTPRKELAASVHLESCSTVTVTFNSSRTLTVTKHNTDTESHVTPVQFLTSVLLLHSVDTAVTSFSSTVYKLVQDVYERFFG